MDCHEPHPAPNEKTQPIQWTERPTGALVGANSLWPAIGGLGLAVIGGRNFLFPVCGQSYWRKLGYDILARNGDPG